MCFMHIYKQLEEELEVAEFTKENNSYITYKGKNKCEEKLCGKEF